MPLCGPNEGGTNVKLIGTGFHANEQVKVKWGIVKTELMPMEAIEEYMNEAGYSEDLQMLRSAESVMPVKQKPMDPTSIYNTVVMQSPRLSNWMKTHGGPIYLSVGANEETDNYFSKESDKYSYTTSFVEFYYYKQPVIKNIYPHGGPITGGTEIVVEGAWFKFIPEYGVMPYCKIGDSVTKGVFESTVRIICPSPAGNSLNTRMPLLVSLNGADYIDTEEFFHYYQHSKLRGIAPESGPNTGGTAISLVGDHFSDLSNPEEFKCRFRPLNKSIPPKYINARFSNDTTILCASPGGWGDVEAVNVDVTFNGVDYTPNA